MLIVLAFDALANAISTVPDVAGTSTTTTTILPTPPALDPKLLDALSTILTFVIGFIAFQAQRWTSSHVAAKDQASADAAIVAMQKRLETGASNAIAYAESMLGKDAPADKKLDIANDYLTAHYADSVQQLPGNGRQFIRARLDNQGAR